VPGASSPCKAPPTAVSIRCVVRVASACFSHSGSDSLATCYEGGEHALLRRQGLRRGGAAVQSMVRREGTWEALCTVAVPAVAAFASALIGLTSVVDEGASGSSCALVARLGAVDETTDHASDCPKIEPLCRKAQEELPEPMLPDAALFESAPSQSLPAETAPVESTPPDSAPVESAPAASPPLPDVGVSVERTPPGPNFTGALRSIRTDGADVGAC
jgi:hypothetical protein